MTNASSHDRSPLFSIVTVCRNAEATLPRAAQSLVDQTCNDFEWLFIDGKSTDGSLAIADRFAGLLRESGVRVICKSEADTGIYDAMNKGIALATGKIVGLLNADDYYERETLARVSEGHRRNPDAGIIYGFLRQMTGDCELQIYRYNYDYTLTHLGHGAESGAQHPTCFVKKAIYNDVGVFDPTYTIAADYEFLLRAKRLCVTFCPLEHVLTNFSMGGASCRMNDEDRLEQRYRAQHKNGLLSDSEYQERKRYLARVRFAQWRKKLLRSSTGIQS